MKNLRPCVPLLVLLLALASPAWAQQGFGSAVAASGEEVVISEPSNEMTSGYVYVYRPGAEGWREHLALTASDAGPGDGFGRALALADDVLLVGNGRDAVYVFRRAGDGWSESGAIRAADGAEGDGFGSAVSLAADLTLVGAGGAADGEGAAYLFRRSGSSWTQVTRLAAPAADAVETAGRGGRRGGRGGGGDEAEETDEDEEPAAARFGAAVALGDGWAAVGAPGTDRTGQVHLFQREGQEWSYASTLVSAQAVRGEAFGSTLAFHDGRLYVGAPGATARIGAVQVYAPDESGEWDRQATLLPFDGSTGAAFGAAIAFDGDDVLVGAPGAGRIYRFARDGDGNWTGASKMAVGDLGGRDRFAIALAAAGDVVVAGIPGDDWGAGTAAILTRTDWGWESTRAVSDVKNYDAVRGGVVECTDGTAADWECENVDLLAFLPLHEMGAARGVNTNDIWGWTDPETDRDYALVGMTDQAVFVDVTDPLQPVYVGKLPRTEGSPGSSWRDIKVYRDHAFIVSDSAREHGMQVFDLTRLREFEGEPITFTEDAHYDGIQSAHNIVINEDTGFAYAVGASGGDNTCGGGLHMINIEDPRNPAFAGCFADASTGRRGTGYSHDAQCIVYDGPDERYQGQEICFGANETALSVADVTDKRNPVAVGMATYPNVGYSHQGWVSDDQRYFFMNDELDELQGKVEGTRTLIWDIQELDDPILVGEYHSTNRSSDHNLYVRGTTMYQSNYVSGLRVLDVSDPENPEPAGFFDTVPYGDDEPGFSGSWSNYPYFDSGVVVVTSGNEGLFVLRYRGQD